MASYPNLSSKSWSLLWKNCLRTTQFLSFSPLLFLSVSLSLSLSPSISQYFSLLYCLSYLSSLPPSRLLCLGLFYYFSNCSLSSLSRFWERPEYNCALKMLSTQPKMQLQSVPHPLSFPFLASFLLSLLPLMRCLDISEVGGGEGEASETHIV